MPLVLGKTLGPQLGSVNLAALWGHLFSGAARIQEAHCRRWLSHALRS